MRSSYSYSYRPTIVYCVVYGSTVSVKAFAVECIITRRTLFKVYTKSTVDYFEVLSLQERRDTNGGAGIIAYTKLVKHMKSQLVISESHVGHPLLRQLKKGL